MNLELNYFVNQKAQDQNHEPKVKNEVSFLIFLLKDSRCYHNNLLLLIFNLQNTQNALTSVWFVW